MDTFEHYRKIPALNNSGMNNLAISPAHYLAGMESHKTTPALEFGRAFHEAVLEPEVFEKHYVIFKGDKRTKAQRELYQSILDAGNEPIKECDYETLLRIQDSVAKHPEAMEIITSSKHEVTHTWNDEASGAACKCRTDCEHPDYVADLKTTVSASKYDFMYSIRKYKYQRQAAFYLDGCKRQSFYFIAVEKTPPYGVNVFLMSDTVIQEGRDLYEPMCELYQQCITTGEWPTLRDKAVQGGSPIHLITSLL